MGEYLLVTVLNFIILIGRADEKLDYGKNKKTKGGGGCANSSNHRATS
jgi:hypothetical protein